MLIPTSFAIHVTYTCPLTCAHCCFSSSPSNKDRLPIETIKGAIDQLDAANINLVAFTGGEPFLLGKQLVEVVEAASGRGFKTRVVTSAFWGKTPAMAKKRLEELAAAGLKELSISWDDFHEEFVSFECVHNAFFAGKELGLRVAVNTVQGANPKWSAERIRKELGLDSLGEEIIVESPLNLTGRAGEELKDAGLRKSRFIGPCPYVVVGPTLSAKNKLLACCGVIPDTEELTLDANFHPTNLSAAIEKGVSSPLLNWLHLRGPYAIMEWISARYNIPIPPRSRVGGNCEACSHLFTTKEIAEKLKQAVSEKADEIASEIFLLESLGLSEPKSIMGLWADGGTYTEVARFN